MRAKLRYLVRLGAEPRECRKARPAEWMCGRQTEHGSEKTIERSREMQQMPALGTVFGYPSAQELQGRPNQSLEGLQSGMLGNVCHVGIHLQARTPALFTHQSSGNVKVLPGQC